MLAGVRRQPFRDVMLCRHRQNNKILYKKYYLETLMYFYAKAYACYNCPDSGRNPPCSDWAKSACHRSLLTPPAVCLPRRTLKTASSAGTSPLLSHHHPHSHRHRNPTLRNFQYRLPEYSKFPLPAPTNSRTFNKLDIFGPARMVVLCHGQP